MRILVAAMLAGWAFATAHPALAHAFLSNATPAVGGTVNAVPAEVVLRFTENIEPAFCSARVTAPGGERIDTGSVRVDATEPAVLHVALKPSAPNSAGAGAYKVVWRAVSVDTHITNGDFTFTVAP
jgi:methionine-rich copper-binding protein CopC